MPGDTLAVHVHEQECDTRGYSGTWPWLFHLEDFIPAPSTVLHEIRDGYVQFSDKICIPVRPMVGTIGTAPAVEAVLSGGMGRYGGNLDAQEACAGSTVSPPSRCPGPFWSMGIATPSERRRDERGGDAQHVHLEPRRSAAAEPQGCPGRALRRATRW